MIIVLGNVTIHQDHLSAALELSREHVARSRLEPGCLSHEVTQDPDCPERLVFVERWEDQASLATHFQVPESGEFVQRIGSMATEAPSISVFEAEQLEI